MLLRQLDGVGGDLNLAQSDVASLQVAQVLLLIESLDGFEPLRKLNGLGRVDAVDALALDLINAHAGDALASFVKSSDDVGHGSALGVHGSSLGLGRGDLRSRRRHVE